MNRPLMNPATARPGHPLTRFVVGRANENVGEQSIVDRASVVVAALASIWFALVAAWGLFGPIFAGHYGSMASFGIVGENMLRWKIWGAIPTYVVQPPNPSLYYCHHPLGNYWITAAMVGIFGHRDWALGLPAVLMSAATPPLLYGIGKHAWGKPAGAAACIGFVMLPITLGFANLHNVEVTVMFGCILFFWGHARMIMTWKTRHLVASVVGIVLAASGDWPAYLAIPVVLGWTLLRGFILPSSWFPPKSSSMYGRWWVLSTCTLLGLLLFWIAFFHHSGKLIDWLSAAGTRSANNDMQAALARRKYWIELSFTPLVIWLGKAAAPLALLRLAVRRSDHEVYSLAMLFGAVVHYVVFAQAADIHIFWSQYFGAYFALALAQLTVSLGWLAQTAANAFSYGRATGLGKGVTLGSSLVLCAVLTPDAISTLRYARDTGGRYNENGAYMRSEADAGLVMRHIADRIPRDTALEVHGSMDSGWVESWALRAPVQLSYALPTAAATSLDRAVFYAARSSALPAEDQKKLVATFHVEVYEDIWVIDRRAPQAPLDAYSFSEREPAWWEWYLYGGVRPIRHIVADPFSTWEWRTHLGQPASVPSGHPETLDQKRIAHNVAVAEKDLARAAQLAEQIGTALSPVVPLAADGLRLRGTRQIRGVEPRLELWFSADGPTTQDLSFGVRSKVERRSKFSLIPADPLERPVGAATSIPSTLFQPGFLYRETIVLMHRIGVERYWGGWAHRASVTVPIWLAGPIDLLTLH